VKLSLDFGEAADKRKTKDSLITLVQVFETSLRLLSPFMPFLTEEVWHAVYDGKPPAKSIALTKYPHAESGSTDANSVQDMSLLQELIVEVRALRKEIGVEEKAVVPTEVRIDSSLKDIISENHAIVERLARVSDVRFVDQISAGLAKHSTSQFDVAVIYERKIDVAAEREKLTKEIARLAKIIANSDRQLNNPGFTAKAPAHIVEGLTKQRDDAQQLLDKLRRDLNSLPG
jgi:valyl-tRNA synthetase